jgi:hypothetical protein
MKHRKREFFPTFKMSRWGQFILSLGLLCCLSTAVYATECFDTYPSHILIEGTEGPDLLEGDAQNHRICGFGGDDTISAGEGDDLIRAGEGDDLANGNADKDFVDGNPGVDTLHCGEGNDTVRGGKGNDFVYGDLGNDTLYGDEGDDIVEGCEGDDTYVYRHDGNPEEEIDPDGDGFDHIDDVSGNDKLSFPDRSSHESITYEKDGNNLLIYRNDNNAQIIQIDDYYSAGTIENISFGVPVILEPPSMPKAWVVDVVNNKPYGAFEEASATELNGTIWDNYYNLSLNISGIPIMERGLTIVPTSPGPLLSVLITTNSTSPDKTSSKSPAPAHLMKFQTTCTMTNYRTPPTIGGYAPFSVAHLKTGQNSKV